MNLWKREIWGKTFFSDNVDWDSEKFVKNDIYWRKSWCVKQQEIKEEMEAALVTFCKK